MAIPISTDPVHRAIHAVWGFESARLHARLARLVRDVGLAEELAQDALVAALETWPASGIPANPAAWLTAVAKNRALTAIARRDLGARKLDELARDEPEPLDLEAVLDDDIGDDLLRLMFIACHPVLSPEARCALTLRLIAGLSTADIAHAYLVPEATIAQRIVRAKRALHGVPFELPRGEDRAARLTSVLEVIYLVFNEGYGDPARAVLCEDALRLGRVLQGLLPDEPEVHGLAALMELHASRLAARTGPDGEHVLLLDQPRGRWDRLLVARGLAALARAGTGPYALQAAISACHARAPAAADTDWAQIAALYAQLHAITGSPVVELNRAMAVAMSEGAAAGLAILDRLAREPALASYAWLPSARGELLARLGRLDEACRELARAADLTHNPRDRERLLARALDLRRV